MRSKLYRRSIESVLSSRHVCSDPDCQDTKIVVAKVVSSFLTLCGIVISEALAEEEKRLKWDKAGVVYE